jgi:hypothetical protein
MPTWRDFNRGAFQCGLYEAQDVFAETDAVDVISLKAKSGLTSTEQWQKNLIYHDPSGMLRHVNPGLKRVRLTGEYELFVVVCQNLHELLYVNAIAGWKEQCRTSICWIDEMWAYAVPRYKGWLRVLEQFDHICIGYRGTVDPLSKALGRQCHWMPGGVDAIRFCPFPTPPERVIDVYSIGRRYEGIHGSLLELSRKKEIFYLHDTLRLISTAAPIDDRQHRDMYANVAQRSRLFLVAPGKMVRDEVAFQVGQSELGFRYYEGAAAGAVLLGQSPHDESFQKMFDWPDSVIEANPDGTDVVETLKQLRAEPERMQAASLRNIQQSLLRHDWVYRWAALLNLAGLSASSGMDERMHRLRALASTTIEKSPRP